MAALTLLTDVPALDLRALADEWVADLTDRGQLRPRSGYAYRERLDSFLTMHSTPEELDRAAMIRWQRSINHLAQGSRRAYVGAVGRFVRWLHLEGHLPADLSAHLSKVKEPRRVPRAMPERDVTAVLGACAGRRRLRDPFNDEERDLIALRDRTIVLLMVSCGLRCGEIASLDIQDYDPAASTLFVSGKGGHERVVPLPDEARDVLERYLEAGDVRRRGPLVHGVGSKTPADGRMSAHGISKRIGQIHRLAGVHVPGDGRSAHALRHTAASDVLERSKDLIVVQQMLGHASLKTTERYLRVADLDRMRSAMAGRSYAAGSVR